MAIRFMRPGKTPFFITPENDGFKMALIKDGAFQGWRERGTRYETKELAKLDLPEVRKHEASAIIGEIL